MLYLKELSREELLAINSSDNEHRVPAIEIYAAGDMAMEHWYGRGCGGCYVLLLVNQEDARAESAYIRSLLQQEHKKCRHFSGSCKAAAGAVLVYENNGGRKCVEFQHFNTFVPTGEPKFREVSVLKYGLSGFLTGAHLGRLSALAGEDPRVPPFVAGEQVHRMGSTVDYWYMHALPFGNQAKFFTTGRGPGVDLVFIKEVEYFDQEQVWGVRFSGMESFYPAACFSKKGNGFFDTKWNPFSPSVG